MKVLVLVPPTDVRATGRAAALARGLAGNQPTPALALGARGATVRAPAGVTAMSVIELAGDELPDFHGLGLLLASAIDVMRADVVLAPATPGHLGFEAVPAAVAAQLDWPLVTAVTEVTRERDHVIVDVRRGATTQRRSLAAPVVLVVEPGAQPAPVEAPAPDVPRNVLTPAQLQVPAARLRPASEAIGELVLAPVRARVATVSSAAAIVARLVGGG